MTFGCGDHDRVVGTQRSDGGGGNGGGDENSSGVGGRTTAAFGGSTSAAGGSNNAETSVVGGATQGGASNGGTSNEPGNGGAPAAGGASLGGTGNASGGANSGGNGGTSGAATTTIDPCSVLACGKNGRCVVGASNTATCVCKDGYTQKSGRCLSTAPITDVSAGDSFACALRSDGTVGCWGQNLDYALGDGVLESNESSNTPLEVPNIEHAIAMDASQHAACVVDAGDLVKCWGFVGGRTLKTPTMVEYLHGANAVSVSGGTACAVIDDGHAFCWGLVGNSFVSSSYPVSERVGHDVRSIYANDGTVCALVSSGAMHCTPKTSNVLSSTPILDHVVALGASGDLGGAPLAVMQDGTVQAPTSKEYPYAYQPLDGYADAVKMTSRSGLTCGVHSDGNVSCSGYNYYGQLCLGTITNGPSAPTRAVGLTNVTQVTVGFSFGCALDATGELRCWGGGNEGELGDSSRPNRVVPYEVDTLTNTASICVGGGSTCALDDASVLRCWGKNHNSASPVQLLSDVAQCVGGDNFCAVMKDGALKCWGTAPMGDGTSTARATPTTVLGLTEVSAVATNGTQHCAVRRDGTVRCWGKNESGQLGDGTTTERLSPVTVAGLTNAIGVAVGPGHACAILQDGSVRCWGKNQSGELGNGTTEPASGPVSPLGVAGIRQLEIVGTSTYAVNAAGEVFKWGGIVSIVYPPKETDPTIVIYDHTPHLWNGPSGVAEISDNNRVRLLNGLIMAKTSNGWAIEPGFGDVKDLDGNNHVCAVLTNGKVRCAGAGSSGQLGDGYAAGRPWADLVDSW
jgi:alpha-tubulin suppressor-like RCC1 family protein